jgi:hypothetical protein
MNAAPEVNRRRLLLGMAAASTVIHVSAEAHAIDAPASSARTEFTALKRHVADENPALIEAWTQFRTAEKEYYAAKDALEWLADEWRHLWPLAPEEILGAANASARGDGIERDIIGRALKRNCADLTKRLSKKFRQSNETTCFFLDDPEDLAERIADLEARPAKGKTAKSLERNRKDRAQWIANLKLRHQLATKYYAETEHVRMLANVEGAQRRLKLATTSFNDAGQPVAKAKAFTPYGFRLKADAVVGMLEYYEIRRDNAFFGPMLDLANSAMDLTKEYDGI